MHLSIMQALMKWNILLPEGQLQNIFLIDILIFNNHYMKIVFYIFCSSIIFVLKYGIEDNYAHVGRTTRKYEILTVGDIWQPSAVTAQLILFSFFSRVKRIGMQRICNLEMENRYHGVRARASIFLTYAQTQLTKKKQNKKCIHDTTLLVFVVLHTGMHSDKKVLKKNDLHG
ncbi:hypothetical protein ACJX0J_018752 [Zea mays]